MPIAVKIPESSTDEWRQQVAAELAVLVKHSGKGKALFFLVSRCQNKGTAALSFASLHSGFSSEAGKIKKRKYKFCL